MVNLHKEGIIAHIQIHDELDISVENDKQVERIVEIMERLLHSKFPTK